VSWSDDRPPVIVVVRCDPVVRGPDVAPIWPQRSRAWKARPVPSSRPDPTPMAQVRAACCRPLSTERSPDADATGTRRPRPATTNRAPAWRRRSQAEPEGEARPRRPRASLARAAGPRLLWVRGSNPAPCCFAARGQSGGCRVTSDSDSPAVTAGARRGPAISDAVRTQRGPEPASTVRGDPKATPHSVGGGELEQ